MRLGLAASKGKWQVVTKVSPSGTKPHVKKACLDLGVNYIDLYYLHRIDPSIAIEVTMDAMNELISEGKMKDVAISEALVSTIRRAHAVCPLTCVQMEWSLCSRDLEDEIVPLCAELGIGIVAYSPMGLGMLVDTFFACFKNGVYGFLQDG